MASLTLIFGPLSREPTHAYRKHHCTQRVNISNYVSTSWGLQSTAAWASPRVGETRHLRGNFQFVRSPSK